MQRSHHGFTANIMDLDIVVSEFERYHVHFRANTLRKSMNSLNSHLWVKQYQ